MEIERKKFQGVLNILSFNRHFYVIGFSVLFLICISYIIFPWPTTLFWLIIGAFIYGLTMPLIVSAYVYDFSGYYNFDWLKKLKTNLLETNQIVNINAGFDETSFILKKTLPNANLQVFDFYNADQHTEPAIIRARKVSLVYPNTTQIKSNNIPVHDKTVDIVFLLSAAHEIRSDVERQNFLRECLRICKPGGKVIMIEHLRDMPNFFAFTFGVTHFFSKKTWKQSFKKSGFTSITETKFTPFMYIFECYP